MNTAIAPRYPWNTIGWRKIERQVVKLQKRIYRAAERQDYRQVRRHQKRLLRSRAAKLLAVRKVTQEPQGQKTPGVDGVANLTPSERLALVEYLRREDAASPVRRVDMPQPGTTAPRPVGSPTRAERAKQHGVTQALEPAGEAQFAPNSDGVRPGRSTWEALGAL